MKKKFKPISIARFGTEFQDLKDEFEKLFGESLLDFFDHPRIFGFNIFKFDDRLLEKFPNEYIAGYSLRRFVIKKYGQEACDFLKNFLLK